MYFSGIKQSLESIDYAWFKPQTYFVLIPVLSLIIRKIQLANILPLNLPVTPQNIDQINAKSRRFANICKWHLRGSMIQMAASIIAIKVFAAPLFSLLALPAIYELVDILIKSHRNSIAIYELEENGAIKMRSRSTYNIFL